MVIHRDHQQFNVSSGVTDGGVAWAELYSSSGNKRFEEVVGEDQDGETLSQQLEAQAVALARARESEEVEQASFQQRLQQFQSTYTACSPDQQTQLRQAIGIEHPKKEKTHE